MELKAWLKLNNMRVREFAALIPCSRGNAYAWMAKTHSPTLAHLQKIEAITNGAVTAKHFGSAAQER